MFPHNEELVLGMIKDTTNFVLTPGSNVKDCLRHGDTIDAYPDTYETDMLNQFPSDESLSTSKDIVSMLKNVHYSVVSKLTDTYIREYDDKIDLL